MSFFSNDDCSLSTSFDLQQFLRSNEGKQWLNKVKVQDPNEKTFSYYAPPVAWEDIHRHDGSAMGDFIFDVTMSIKDSDGDNISNNAHNNHPTWSNWGQSTSNTIRYVLRPENMKDPISLQSTQAINIPIGNFKGDPLRNVQLIDLLKNTDLLKEIGIDCKMASSLYEPLLDEPAHLLPDIHCICGQSMQRVDASTAYNNNDPVWCDNCSTESHQVRIEGEAFHCSRKWCKEHEQGFDLCPKCAGLQIRQFFESQSQRKEKDKTKTKEANDEERKVDDEASVIQGKGSNAVSFSDALKVYEHRVTALYLEFGAMKKMPKFLKFLEGKTVQDLDEVHHVYDALCVLYQRVPQPKVAVNESTKKKKRKKEKEEKMEHKKSVATDSRAQKWGKGGMMFSVGCGLLSGEDMGKSYEIEVYLYPSSKYRDGKCLCIITTSEGTTANIIEQGKRERLQFAQNGKECDWGIATFDTSTDEGRINERTGKSAETDMIIYFIPIQEDLSQTANLRSWDNWDHSNNSNTSSNMSNLGTYSYSFGGSLQSLQSSGTSTFNSGGGTTLRKRKRNRTGPCPKRFKGRSRSRGRKRNTVDDEPTSEPMTVKFAKHKMTVSDRQFALRGQNLKYPLKRIRELPIRAFLRGAVFFDQKQRPDSGDAARLSNYLQSRYNDTELLSIHSYSVLIKKRAKLLPISEEYYRHLYSKVMVKSGVFDDHFTKHAKEENELCVICMDESIEMVMEDCYHMCLCEDCSSSWNMSCPICRAEVKRVVKENQVDKQQIKIIPMAASG